MSKISIIVPVYNVEKYLNKCVDSLLSQTYSNIEIILIDDGSNDSSGIICDEYASKFSNIIVKHIENGGQGRARNIGISMASGEYIMFCDSDDYYDYDMVEYLYNAIEDETQIKIAMCGLKFVFSDDRIEERLVFNEDFVTDFNTILNMYFNEDKIVSSPVNKIYHKSVFDDLKYPENMIYEDRYISLPMFIKFPTIHVCSKAKYNYILRKGSTIQSSFSIKNMDYIKVLEQEKKLLSEYPAFNNQVVYSYNNGLEMLLRKIIIDGYFNNKEYYNIVLLKLKENTKENKEFFIKKDLFRWCKYYKLKYITIFAYSFRNKIGKLIRMLKK